MRKRFSTGFTSRMRRLVQKWSEPDTRSLQERIRVGDAEPISDLERQQLQQMKDLYIRRFGHDPR